MKSLSLFSLYFLLFSLNLQAQGDGLNAKFQDFIPIEPVEFFGNVELSGPEGGVNYKYVKLLTKEEQLRYLTNETVLVSVAEVDKKGGMRYLPGRISQKGQQYLITMDYVKFATVELRKENEIVGEACVGAGFRISLNISARGKDVNLGDLFAIGMAVKGKQVYGSLRVSAMGIHDPEITSVIPLPSEISGAAIQSVMQAMSTIKYKMYDPKAHFSPQVMALRPLKEGVSMEELNNIVLQQQISNRKNVATPKTEDKK